MPEDRLEYIYHQVPQNMSGNILYPLFDLKIKKPEFYINEIKKYDDHPQRKLLPQKRINVLNCTRGEVLHCSSIHPHLVFDVYKSVFSNFDRSILFYKIPISKIEKHKAVLFDMNRPEYQFGQDDPDSVFDLIDPKTYQEIKIVPNQVKEFYIEWKERGEVGAPIWGKVPHVFVHHEVNISDCEIIDWRNPIL